MPIKTSYFGEVDVPDGGISLMDGGIHGVQGHTITWSPNGAPGSVGAPGSIGSTEWQRRVDGVSPSGRTGAGLCILSAAEIAELATWSDALWALAAHEASVSGHARFYGQPTQPPRWVWVIVVRRGNEVRAAEGGGMSWGDEPTELRAPLSWLRSRVDALSALAPTPS